MVAENKSKSRIVHKVTLLPGDGIGPEVVESAIALIDTVGVAVQWERFEVGLPAIEKFGTAIPDQVFDSIRKNKVVLKGPVTTPVGKGFQSVNVALRKALDLYVNLRPVRSLPGIKSRYENIDLIVVRENTEDLYSGLEHVVVPGIVESIKVITERASRRIAQWAFNYAVRHNRKTITAVHKANIMKLSDGLFLDCARSVAQQFPQIHYNEVIVDNCAMQLVLNPRQFDILLLENLYGDIISDIGAGLVGGLGVVPGANIGENCAMFEAVHGSAPDIAGKNLANPIAVIFSALLMLHHLSEHTAAERIERSIKLVTSQGKWLTRDLGGIATTQQVTQALIDHLN